MPSVSHAEDPTFSRLADATAYVRQCAEKRLGEYFFYLTDSKAVSWDIDTLLNEFCECSGIIVHLAINRREVSPGKLRIGLRPTYRPGVLIADAWEKGNTAGLSSDEKKALAHAEKVAKSIRSRYASDLDRELAVHDYLCEILTYEDADTSQKLPPQRMATYALNSGKANCQGYADAFYLLGTLVGLNVRIQDGEITSGGHCWNAVELDGKWYALDVTADDTDGNDCAPEAPCYIYFNVGRDLLAASKYTWKDTQETADIIDHTDGNYFFYHGGAGQYGAAFEKMRDLTQYCYDLKKNEGIDGCWTMLVNGAKGFDTDDFHNSMKKTTDHHGGPTRWTFWYWQMGGNLYIFNLWRQF